MTATMLDILAFLGLAIVIVLAIGVLIFTTISLLSFIREIFKKIKSRWK